MLYFPVRALAAAATATFRIAHVHVGCLTGLDGAHAAATFDTVFEIPRHLHARHLR